jgi:protein-S-isoprenylcysteine O-methyltransferase Ste14
VQGNGDILLHRIGWLACVVYATIPPFWLAIHPRVAYWRSRRRSPYRALLPFWVLMGLVLGAITSPWRNQTLYQARWSWVPACLLLFAGLWIYGRSGRGFSPAQLGGLPELASAGHEQRLAMTGIRARVRHPIYLGHLCEMAAWSVGTGLMACYGLTIFALVSGAIMIRLEDRELEQRFGDAYRAYRQKVPAVLPRI